MENFLKGIAINRAAIYATFAKGHIVKAAVGQETYGETTAFVTVHALRQLTRFDVWIDNSGIHYEY